MKRKLLTFVFLFTSLCLRAQSPFAPEEYHYLDRYHNGQMSMTDSVQFMLIADSLDAEGIANNDIRLRLLCADLKAVFFYSINDSQTVEYLEQAIEYAKELGLMLSYTSYVNNLAGYYLNIGDYNKALEYAEQMLEEAQANDYVPGLIQAYRLMGGTYNGMQNENLAIEQYKKMLLEIENHPDLNFPPDLPLLAYTDLAIIYYEMEDIEQGEYYLNLATAIEPNLIEAPFLRAEFYLNHKNKKEFKRQYNIAKSLDASIIGTTPSYLPLFEMMNYASDGKIKEAYEIIDNYSASDLTNMKSRVSVCKWTGNWEDATKELEKLMHYKDSINHEESMKLLAQRTAEVRTILETKDKEAEILRQRYILYIEAIGLLALLIIVIGVIYRNIEVNKKNKALVANINELLDMRKKEKEQFLATVAESEETKSQDRTNNLSIVQQYIYELTSRRLFCDINFDRDQLLDDLHLQKTGFWKAFEEETGTTALKYILNLRLEYAAEQIREHPEYTIEAIAMDCGIASRSTFYRNFATRFGITPTIFREQCNQE